MILDKTEFERGQLFMTLMNRLHFEISGEDRRWPWPYRGRNELRSELVGLPQMSVLEVFTEMKVDLNDLWYGPNKMLLLHHLCRDENYYEISYRASGDSKKSFAYRNVPGVQQLVSFLIYHGADPKLRYQGKTAFDFLLSQEQRVDEQGRKHLEDLACIMRGAHTMNS